MVKRHYISIDYIFHCNDVCVSLSLLCSYWHLAYLAIATPNHKTCKINNLVRIMYVMLNSDCIYMGLPRSWWEDSERHIQFSIVEHHSQLKALPVPVSSGFYSQQSDLAVQRLCITIRDTMMHRIQYSI